MKKKLVAKLKNNYSIKRLFLGLSIIILSYVFKHYLFDFITLNNELQVQFNYFQYKFELPKDILGSILALLCSLGLKGFLEVIIDLFLIPETADIHSDGGFILKKGSGSPSNPDSGGSSSGGSSSGRGDELPKPNSAVASSSKPKSEDFDEKSLDENGELPWWLDPSHEKYQELAGTNQPKAPEFNTSTDIVQGTDFSKKENTKNFTVEELAEFLSIAEEIKNMYAEANVPAYKEQFEIWTIREGHIAQAISDRLDTEAVSNEELDSSSKGKGKSPLPSEDSSNLEDVVKSPSPKGKGVDYTPYNLDGKKSSGSSDK